MDIPIPSRQLFINGDWKSPILNKRIPVINPSTQQTIGQYSVVIPSHFIHTVRLLQSSLILNYYCVLRSIQGISQRLLRKMQTPLLPLLKPPSPVIKALIGLPLLAPFVLAIYALLLLRLLRKNQNWLNLKLLILVNHSMKRRGIW